MMHPGQPPSSCEKTTVISCVWTSRTSIVSSRMWRQRPCGWKNMAKWCWCWREPLRAPALPDPQPQAGTGIQ
uniref:Rap guanine nucleotide exchange factor 3 n=1 Tax=Nomascus leucogenys TaxID=61853 RepID=A0A2I3GJH4_NOMLE